MRASARDRKMVTAGAFCMPETIRDRERAKGGEHMKLTRYEQETIINFNAEEEMATVYTRDPAVMKEMDTLVNDYPEVYRCTGVSDIDKTYEIPKTAVSYRKPRRITEAQRAAAQSRMKQINESRKEK